MNAAGDREETGRSEAPRRAAIARSGVIIVRAAIAHSGVTIAQAASVAGSEIAAGLQIAAGPRSAEDSNSGASMADPSVANLGAANVVGLIVHIAGPLSVHRLTGRRLPTETSATREGKAGVVAKGKALTAHDPSAAQEVSLRVKNALAAPAENAASGRDHTAGEASNAVNSAAGRGAIGPRAAVQALIDHALIGHAPIDRASIGHVLHGPSKAIAAMSPAKVARSGDLVRGASFHRANRAASAGSRLFALSVKKAASGPVAKAGNGLAAKAGNRAIGERAKGSVSRIVPGSVREANVSGASTATTTVDRVMAVALARIAAAARGADAANLRGER